METLLLAPEKIILTKAFVMERERYDGADIAHLLLHCARIWTGNTSWTAQPALARAPEPP